MSKDTKQNNNLLPSHGEENTCELDQKQARIAMKKEDERKSISKMMKDL